MNEYYHAWNCVFKGKPKPFNALVKNVTNLKNAWDKFSEFDLAKVGIGQEYIQTFKNLRLSGEPFKEYEGLQNDQIIILTRRDNLYPNVLRTMYDPPEILYIKGHLPSFNKHYLSIVGTRDMSAYGQRATKQIVSGLNKDFVIVSGLARGIDTSAHKAAVENGLDSIAVLGFGINKIPQYLKIFTEDLILMSEFPPDMPGDKYSFPQRNRIIAGLSKATVVVEAGYKSGARITAKFANDMGKEIFAVPGEIFNEKSMGTNELIKNGEAGVLINPNQIYEKFGITKEDTPKKCLPIYQQLIINELKLGPQTKLSLLHKILIPPSKLTSALTELELADIVDKGRNGKYFLKLQC